MSSSRAKGLMPYGGLQIGYGMLMQRKQWG